MALMPVDRRVRGPAQAALSAIAGFGLAKMADVVGGVVGGVTAEAKRKVGTAVVERIVENLSKRADAQQPTMPFVRYGEASNPGPPKQRKGKLQASQVVKRNKRKQQQVDRRVLTPPAAFGYYVHRNAIDPPVACSFQGMPGVRFRGSQVYCDVKSGDGSTRHASFVMSGISELLSFAGAVFRPTKAVADASFSTHAHCALASKDPLATQASIYRLHRVVGLKFKYIPNVTGGTGAGGQIAWAWTPTFPLSTSTLSAQIYTNDNLLQYACSDAFPIWTEAELDVTPYLRKDRFLWNNSNPPVGAQYYTANSTTDVATPITDLSPGSLLMSCDLNTGSVSYGRIVIEYAIEFYYRGPSVQADGNTQYAATSAEPTIKVEEEDEKFVKVDEKKKSK